MKVLVAMSGGVDSSVAGALLLERGHDVTGVTLRLWGGESDSGCCSVADVEDARRVAAQLGIPHYVFNLAERFERDVVVPYTQGYARGATPNPCVECNRSIKFGALLERARVLGFDAIATGHHARAARGADGVHRLRRGVDAAKDQSYVLYMLGQAELARTLLPVGELTKAEVRSRAAALGLRTAAKAESMDVCFIARGQRRAFLDERVPAARGMVVDPSGRVLGHHDGVAHFTVGQRRGLGVAVGERRYVVDVDAARATVTVGTSADLARRELAVHSLRWVHRPVDPGAVVSVQIRAHGRPVPGHLVAADLGPSDDRRAELVAGAARVVLDEPLPRVAPGQVVALYDADELLGGGLAA